MDLLGDAMKRVIIDDRLLEALRMNYQDGQMSRFEFCVANVSPQYIVKNEDISI